ncbi:hypothetical protein SAMN05216251_12082 [Actinacidiphila alni]|uniref:Uncharacterized protein n=1 Tax=Actinacidiphila alni TaxID=380248 RepID=A0A1I2JY62_9ACTN|nr:hypothetical protein [Actinacidiphila alni]SFF59073.1 hypothetical protein SAMN05216251_12082 [Actinacidiphila alni]
MSTTSKRHTGTEPVRARTAGRLRLLLSLLFAPVFLVGAGLLAWWAAESGSGDAPGRTVLAVLAGVCALLFLVAVTDAAVLGRRARHPARRTTDR